MKNNKTLDVSKKEKRRVLSIISLFLMTSLYSCPISAQVNFEYRPPTPRTPEVSSFLRYGEYDINHYTGTPDISFPLFEICDYGINVPITLSYIGGGCRVSEGSTWVGQNWNLLPGGCISESVIGNDIKDFDQYNYAALAPFANYESERILMHDGYRNSYGWLCRDDLESLGYSFCDKLSLQGGYRFFDDLVSGRYYQPNIYTLNALGYSCKFFIHPQTNLPVILNGKDHIKIVDNREAINHLERGWIVTLPNGNVVQFTQLEYVISGVEGTGTFSINSKTWKIKKIILTNGEIIDFNYTEYKYQLESIEDIYTHNWENEEDYWFNLNLFKSSVSNALPSGESRWKYVKANYYSQYLTSIISSTHTVTFNLTPGIQKPRLEYIDFQENVNPMVKRRYRFVYEAYKHWGNGWNINQNSSVGDEENYIKYKLKTLTKCHVEGNIENQEPPYQFEYIEDIGLPSILSRSQDYWGYFNGQANTTLLCDESQMFSNSLHPSIPSTELNLIRSFCNANRCVYESYAVQGSLKKIIYPTKGYSIFNFESHEFYCEEGYLLTRQEQLSGYTGVDWAPSKGAGLRIQSVANYDLNGKFIKKTRYHYELGNHLKTIRLWRIGRTGICAGFYRSLVAYAYNYSGDPLHENGVSYTFVSSIDCDTENDDSTTHNGQTTYQFYNDRIEYLVTQDNTPLFYNYHHTNGLLRRIEVYDSDSIPLKETIYNYQKLFSQEFICIRARHLYVCPEVHMNGIMENNNAYWVSYYPLIGEVWKNTEISEYTYINGIKTAVKKTINDYYNDGYYQLKSSTIINSTGDNLTTIYQYLSNMNSGVYLQMKGLNIIDTPIEQTTLVNGEYTGSQLLTYKFHNGHYVRDKMFSLKIDAPLSSYTHFDGTTKDTHYNSEPDISYDNYDAKCNLLQITGRDGVPVSFLWDSSGNYVMSQVSGCSFTQVGSQNAKSFSHNSAVLWDSLNTLAPDAQITTYSYKHFGNLLSQTEPSKRTIYYDYDNFGRLQQSWFYNGDDIAILEKYKYNYQNQ